MTIRIFRSIFLSLVVNYLGRDGVSGEGGTDCDGGELELTQLDSLYGAHTRVVIPVPGMSNRLTDRFLKQGPKILAILIFRSGRIKSITHFIDLWRRNLQICVINEEGKETNWDADEDHPHNSVEEILPINEVSDAMNSGFLL